MEFRYVATSFAKGYGVQRKEKLEKIPKVPGVYVLSGGKEILYIGKAANLRERIKNHFQRSSYRDNLFIDKVTRVGWLETQSDIDALLLESQLIKQKKPKYNVMWRDDKKYFYVGITKEALPRVFITHQPSAIGKKSEIRNPKSETNPKSQNTKYKILNTHYIGPFVDGKAIKQVLRLLRRIFPYYTLRRGSGQAAKKHPQLPCPWCHLGLCPGSNPNPKEYRRNIRNLAAVLRGKKTSVLKSLKRAMEKAAQLEKYEEAAKLRDQVRAFERVFMHSVVELRLQLIYYDRIQRQLKKLMGAKKQIVRVEAYDISNIQGKFATGSMVTFLKGKPAKEWYRKFKIHISGKPNDFAMMQELLSRRLRHKEWPYPDLMVIDGGKAQLSAALAAYKIQHTRYKIQIAALAKKHNELFFPRRSKPFLLKNLPQEVSNLLLHIRDEAHRFAITYHRKLRRIDAFPEK